MLKTKKKLVLIKVVERKRLSRKGWSYPALGIFSFK